MTNLFSVSRSDTWKGSGVSMKMPLVMSVLCVVAMVFSDAVSASSSFPMPVSDMVAPALIVLFCPQSGDLSARNMLAFPFATVMLVAIVSVFRIASSFYRLDDLVFDFIESVPAILALLMLLFVAHALRAGSQKWQPPLLQFFFAFTLLVFSFYMDMQQEADMLYMIFLSAASIVFYGAVCAGAYRSLMSEVIRMEDSVDADDTAKVEEETEDDSHFRELFCRIHNFFEEEKPYLDENLTLGDVARMLYSNKVYISKAIHDHTGKNFRQYVNHYRILHSMEIFKKDPGLRVSELAAMSGFRTLASYNMAFRVVMNDSPSEWCRRIRLGSEPRELEYDADCEDSVKILDG